MTDDAQPLIEFVTNLLTDVDSGAITAHEALAASGQYGYLRELLDAQAGILSQAELVGDEEFARAVRAMLGGAFTQLKGLASFQNQTPDAPAPEQEVRAVAALREAAFNRIKKDAAAKLAPYQDRRRAFIHTLVEKYSTNEKIVNAALSQAEAATTKNGFTDALVASVGGGSPAGIQTALTENAEYVTTAVSVARSQKEMLDVVFTNLDVSRPDVVVDVLLNRPSNESDQDTKLRAIKLAGVAADLQANTKPLATSRGFFTAGSARGATAGAQAAASGILSLVGEPFREMMLKEKVSGSLRTMFSNTQTMIDRLGENFVHSSAFSQLTAGINRSLGDKSAMSQPRGVIDDIFSTVFRGPLGSATALASRERVFNFFELARASGAAPKGLEFLPNGALPWNIFADSTSSGRFSSSGRGVGRAWFPSLGLAGLSSWIGNSLASGFDRTTSFLLSSPRIAGGLAGSRRAAGVPTPFFSDMPKLVATVVVVVILLLFVLQSPLNSSLVNYSAKVSALLASLSENTEVEIMNSCAGIEGVHIYQSDPAWSGYSCQNARPDVSPQCTAANTTCKIGPSGCGSASMTMILNAFGAQTGVKDVWDEQHRLGGYVYDSLGELPGCMTDNNNSLNVLRNAGLSVSEIGKDELSSVFKATSQDSEECKVLVLASVSEMWENSGPTGHIIVITGVSGNSVTALDPARQESASTLRVVSVPSVNKDISIKRLWIVANNKGGQP